MNLTATTRRAIAAATLLAAATGATILTRFPPTQYTFYPRCPVHAYLGILCPGCGATRALAALLHGQMAEAWHWNALFVTLLPFLLAFGTVCLYRAIRSKEFRWPAIPNAAVGLAVGLCVLFTIGRNL